MVGAVALSATYRKQERIGPYTYTVEYTEQADGTLLVRPTLLWTTKGWRSPEQVGVPQGAERTDEEPRSVLVGNKYYTVSFSHVKGFGAEGKAFAVHENGEWRYFDKEASKEEAGSQDKKTVAEFTIRGSTLDHVGATLHETKPFWEDGAYNEPDVHITVTPRLQDSKNALAINADVHIEGNSKSTSGKPVLGRYTQAQVNSRVQGGYSREVHVTTDGINAGTLRGGVNIDYTVTPSTEARRPFFRKLFLKGATKQAVQKTEQKIPIKKQELYRRIDVATGKIIDKTNELLRDGVSKYSGFDYQDGMPNHRVHFETRSPRNGDAGAISLRMSQDSEKARAERPKLKAAKDGGATLYLHEDAVMDGVNPILAAEKNRRMTFGEAIQKICAPKIMKYFDLCANDAKLDPKIAGTTMTFDGKEPLKVSFRNGEVKLEINATHEKQMVPGIPAVKGAPFHIEIVYEVTPKGLKRKDLQAWPADKPPKKEEPSKTQHAGFQWNKAFRYISDIEQDFILESYGKAFPQNKGEFPTIEVPTRALFEGADDKSPKVTESVKLGILDAKAEDGWFAISASADALK